MLAISLFGGVLFAPSGWAAATALVIGPLAVLAAMLVGRRIRKNSELQTLASLALAATAAPVVVAGGGSVGGAALLSGTLGAAYLSGTLAVRAILERAKKRPGHAKVAGWLSIALPMAGAMVAYGVAGPLAFAALAVTTIYTTATFALTPHARKLKLIGVSLALTHSLSAVLLSL